jgi:hypothetical protein
MGGPKVEPSEPAHLPGTFVPEPIGRCTHAYARFRLCFNLMPLLKRGSEFRVHPHGSVTVCTGGSREPRFTAHLKVTGRPSVVNLWLVECVRFTDT